MPRFRFPLALLMLEVLLGSAILVPATALAERPEARVRYISAEKVYLDAGLSAGFAVGDTLQVLRAGRELGSLLVVYAAEHSAACDLLQKVEPLQIGDLARGSRELAMRAEGTDSTGAQEQARRRPPAASGRAALPLRQGRAALSGSLGMGWDAFRDEGESARGYDRFSLRLNLRATELAGRDLQLQLNLRQIFLQREGSAGDERRLRLYAACLESGAREGLLHLALGRLGAGRLSGAGALDGLYLGLRQGGGVEWGGYLGAMPDWSAEDLAQRGARYGLFLRQELASAHWTLETVSETLDGRQSRDYLLLGGNWRRGALSLRERVELDWNRGWRRARSPGALSLSNLRIGGDWRLSESLSLGLDFDSRETPLDGDWRSLPDSLFQAARSQGSSLTAQWRPRQGAHVTGRFGWRGRESEDRGSISYGLGLGVEPGFDPAMRLDLRLTGFDGPAARGLHPDLALGRRLKSGHELGLVAGIAFYTPRDVPARQNRWLRVESRFVLPARAWLGFQLERDGGDDVRGWRVVGELGRRF